MPFFYQACVRRIIAPVQTWQGHLAHICKLCRAGSAEKKLSEHLKVGFKIILSLSAYGTYNQYIKDMETLP